MMIKRETVQEFIRRLKLLDDIDLTDKGTVIEIKKRFDQNVRPEIEKQDQLQAKSLSRAFTKVIY